MLKKILGTIGTRYLIALLNLLLIFINAKALGKEGIGLVGLIYASANIALIFNSVLCGNTIIYFMNRYPLRYVFWPATIWSFIGSAVACGGMQAVGMIPEGYGWEIYGLAVLMSLVAVNSRVLLGKDRVFAFNLTVAIQGGALFFFLLFFYFVVDVKEVSSYVSALFLTNIAALLLSIGLLIRFLRRKTTGGPLAPAALGKLLKEMFVYGLWSSTDNLAEGLTTRLNYFMVERFGGLGGVGLLDSGTKISESVWHISRSVSFIEYSSVAKMSEAEEQRRITLRLFKLTYCAMLSLMGVILLIPEWVYTDYLFSAEFAGIREVILALSAGIVALGSNSILGHYFIGSGKIKYSAACSCVGLAILLATGFFLIPAYGITGAACTSSIAYIGMLLFSLFVFTRQTGTTARELLPTAEDWKEIRSRIFRKRSGY